MCHVVAFFVFQIILSFSNILKATANDEVSLENGSLTKSQKNFSSSSSTSNNKSPVSAQHGSPVLSRRREVTEEEAERFDTLKCLKGLLPLCFTWQLVLIAVPLSFKRFIQQVNQAAVTIQRWYRRHAKRQHTSQAALKRILANKRKVSDYLLNHWGLSHSFCCFCTNTLCLSFVGVGRENRRWQLFGSAAEEGRRQETNSWRESSSGPSCCHRGAQINF